MEIHSRPKISITDKKRESAPDLTEIVPDAGKNMREELEMPDQPAIDIADVGKVAVGETSLSQAIDLNKRTLSSRDIQEIKVKKVKKTGYTPQIMQKPAVSIKKRKRYATGKPSIGYGKGISLRKVPIKRKVVEQVKVSQPVAEKVEETASGKIVEAKPDEKSVEIVGAIVGRKIIKSYLPVYPDWARAQNIEADVVVRFYVSPEGRVREKLHLERTSGYSKLDKLVMEALRKWIFEPVKAGDQWGVITVRYLLE